MEPWWSDGHVQWIEPADSAALWQRLWSRVMKL
jgi:hypothetical protein